MILPIIKREITMGGICPLPDKTRDCIARLDGNKVFPAAERYARRLEKVSELIK